MTSLLIKTVASVVERAGLTAADRLVVGLSGGVDSLALTLLLLQLERERHGPSVHPVHVDHRLRSDSAEAASQVAKLEQLFDRKVGLIVVDVGAWDARLRQGTESAARAARYAALAGAAAALGTGWIAVAHNANDQAESVLLALSRGASSVAISGMRQDAKLAIPLQPSGRSRVTVDLLRPLLGVRRLEIEAFLGSTTFEPIEDPSNRSPRFQRNSVRHQVMPSLEQAIPGAVSAIARSADLLRSDDDLLQRLASEAIDDVCETPWSDAILIRRDRFRALPEPIQRRVLWRLLERINVSARRIKAERVDTARLEISGGRDGRTIEVIENLIVYLDYERAAIGRRETLFPALRRESSVPQLPPWMVFNLKEGFSVLRFGDGWELRVDRQLNCGKRAGCPRLRTRRPGDRMATGSGTSLQDFMVNKRVPRYLRDWLPLVAYGSTVVWVGGVTADRFATDDGALGLMLVRPPMVKPLASDDHG